jgi:hypothetical protein
MLTRLKDICAGETCVIIGNGPSLKEAPRELLDKHPTFGANKLFVLSDKYDDYKGFVPSYYSCIDSLMIHDCTERLMTDYKPPEVFVPRHFPVPGANYLNMRVANSFSENINDHVVYGGTVTFVNLQIAFYMGFQKAILVGVDHNYGKYNKKKPGKAFVATGEDDAHFDPDYFKDGRLYAAPELAAVERTFSIAKSVWGINGREIVNASARTELNVFPLVNAEDLL